MTEQHTPGPWSTDLTDKEYFNEQQPLITAANGRCVAEVLDLGMRHDEESVANGRLIAAAPELLAALQMITPLTHYPTCSGLNFLTNSSECEEHCTCGSALARAAIAKAKGE